MSSGGGDNGILDSVANVFTNVATLGMVGYEGGRFGQGMLTNAADEAIGEVTGRNASRDALYEQRRTLDAEVAQREQQMRDELMRREQDDLSASNAAGNMAQRFGSAIRSGGVTGNRDFLGL